MERTFVSQTNNPKKDLHIGKPRWLKSPIATGETLFRIKKDLREKTLYTVCEEAKCPNISKCWNAGTATLMILGDTCTRACRFCNVKTGNPQGVVDPKEPEKMAESVKIMNLDYVVLTMVDRDDLEDGGATHVGQTIAAIRDQNPGIKVEILAGDFRNESSSLNILLEAQPEVFAHNVETVKRLSPRVRDARANYQQSLEVLSYMKKNAQYPIYTKSALMLGLGEEREEIVEALQDLRMHGVDFMTIGQYMRPSKRHLSVKRWVPPEEFQEIREIGLDLGFKSIASSPLVRSSYMAGDFYKQAVRERG